MPTGFRDSGRVGLSQMCTELGGIECDVTITTLGADNFYVISAAAAQTHDYAWMKDHCPSRGVELRDVSGHYGVLTLAGPASRDILQALTSFDCSEDNFPFFSMREIHLGMAPTRCPTGFLHRRARL